MLLDQLFIYFQVDLIEYKELIICRISVSRVVKLIIHLYFQTEKEFCNWCLLRSSACALCIDISKKFVY
jgi:hypothetical protein